MTKLKKRLLTALITITGVMVIVFLCISYIAKYLIEKYDVKFSGREITMNHAYVNPLTGYVHFSDVKIYELKSDSIFFSAKGLSADLSLRQLFSGRYIINQVELEDPQFTIIQNKKELNFSDLILKFTSKGDSSKKKKPVEFEVLSIKITNGTFYYSEKITPIFYFIKKVNLESPAIHWNVDTIAVKFSFMAGIGKGDAKGDFSLNTKNLDYRLKANVYKYDLNIIGQYLKDLTNYGNFSANLDANINSRGNFIDQENTTNSGLMIINDFHFGKTKQDDYSAFEKLAVSIKEVSPKKHIYYFDSIAVTAPFFKYELYDSLDNLQTMFGRKGSNIENANSVNAKFNLVIEIARYIKILGKNIFESNYRVNRVAVYRGNLWFNDFSGSEKFSIGLNPLCVIADSIDKKYKRVNVNLTSGIKPYGNSSVYLSINPNNSQDFDMQYRFQKLPVAMLNPYTISFTSFPLNRGTVEINGSWNVRNGVIKSVNHFVLIDPRLDNRVRNKGTKWLPMRLMMFFVRERGNVIDYEIPLTGDLKNPKSHLKDLIMDVVKNIFIKPATTPYGMTVRNVETEIEEAFSIKWQMRDNALTSSQEKFVESLADYLAENPGAKIAVYPQQYAGKEKEYILFFEAKKKYFLANNNKNVKSFNEADSEKVVAMSSKNPAFVTYLEKQIKGDLVFTIQDKCLGIIDSTVVNAKYKQLNKQRADAFMLYFVKKGVENQIKMGAGNNIVPYNGFSFYSIQYKGEFPETLVKANQRMNELNDESPRKEYQQERKRTKNPR